MEMLFDSHCHFCSPDPAAVAPVLRRAREAGVDRILAVGGSPEMNAAAACASKCAADDSSGLMPDVYCACGRDRDQLGGDFPPIPDVPLSAWGEIGLDYHYSPGTREAQMRVFAEGLEEARRRDLPVIVHTREADDDTLALLREIPSRGVIHCFTGSAGYCAKLLDLGFYISISGIVTFRMADNVREMSMAIPDDRLLIETDSPFLAPVPLRGRDNEPAFLRHTADFLARLRGMPVEELAALTSENALRMLRVRRVPARQTASA